MGHTAHIYPDVLRFSARLVGDALCPGYDVPLLAKSAKPCLASKIKEWDASTHFQMKVAMCITIAVVIRHCNPPLAPSQCNGHLGLTSYFPRSGRNVRVSL